VELVSGEGFATAVPARSRDKKGKAGTFFMDRRFGWGHLGKMSLSSLGLDAFFEVAKTGNFSLAAKSLHVTQSALSQRIKNLEGEVGTPLFIREKQGARLTESGERLLQYCRTRDLMEAGVLHEITSPKKGGALAGSIRVAGFSTVMRSVVVPSLTGLLNEHPAVTVELMSRELRDIPGLLRSGACDIALSDDEISLPGVKSYRVGVEKNCLVEATAKESPKNVFLDHDGQDRTTVRFLSSLGKEITSRRLYLDEIYAILDGVALGWGRAVVPQHLLNGRSDIRPVAGYKLVSSPVYLSYCDSTPLPRLIKSAVETLNQGFSKYL